jgi:hypothetical protein
MSIISLLLFLITLTSSQNIDWAISVTATSAQAVPATPATTGKSCTVTMNWNKTASTISGLFTCSLTGPITGGAHIHTIGPTGVLAGGSSAVINFVLLSNENSTLNYSVSVSLPADSAKFSDICNDRSYINIHTAENPAGEVRANIYGMAAVCGTGKSLANLDQTKVNTWGTTPAGGQMNPWAIKTIVGSGTTLCNAWLTYVPTKISIAGECSSFALNSNISGIILTDSMKMKNVSFSSAVFSASYPFSFTQDPFNDADRDALCAAKTAATYYKVIILTDASPNGWISGDVMIDACPIVTPLAPSPMPTPTPAPTTPAGSFVLSISVLLPLFLSLILAWWK